MEISNDVSNVVMLKSYSYRIKIKWNLAITDKSRNYPYRLECDENHKSRIIYFRLAFVICDSSD